MRKYEIPDSVVRLLYLLLEREIQKGYPSLSYSPEHDKAEDRHPAIRFAKGLDHIFSRLTRLPKIYDKSDSKFSTSIFTIGGFNQYDINYLYSLRTPVERYRYYREEARYKRQLAILEEGIHDNYSKEDKGWIRARLRETKQNLKDLKEPGRDAYLTQFWSDLLYFNVSFDLPNRNRHCHILGVPGSGKTSLIKKLVYQDMQSDGAVIVMSPKGNLISTLSRVPCDRTIWIEDWSDVGLNLLDLDPALFVWVLESLLESDPSPRQKAYLLYATTKVKNLTELEAFLNTKPPEEYKDVPLSIKWRLDILLKGSPTVRDIFSRDTNLDILDVMDSGKVLLLDTQSLGEAGSSLVGRFIVALISLSIKKRKNKRPCYCYLDEFPQYITEHLEYMLDLAREANLGLHLAHQNLAQLSPRLKASVHNSALKWVGKVNYDDSREMGREMGVDPDTLKNQPDFQFMFYGFPKAFPIKINWYDVDNLATAHADHFTPQQSMPKQTKVENVDSDDENAW